MFSDNPNKQQVDMIAQPVRVGALPRPDGELSTSQAKRVYSIDGKSVNLVANGGGEGAKTGLYAVPCEPMIVKEATQKGYTEIEAGDCVDLTMPSSKTRRGRNMKEKANCLTKQTEYYQYCGTINQPIYEVKDGLITIKGKEYPIKLKDGKYIIRKLTPIECERLQTLPDNYTDGVSNAQRYKGLGNGWTAEVIIHILSGALKDVPRDEEIVVLSMYDGIGTGRYCLDKMGFTNVKYFAYEIDKYAKQIAMKNYPDIIQMGDAFDLRHPDWTIGY
jgi:DNA (cytosine-5)-methyltransferase 3A